MVSLVGSMNFWTILQRILQGLCGIHKRITVNFSKRSCQWSSKGSYNYLDRIPDILQDRRLNSRTNRSFKGSYKEQLSWWTDPCWSGIDYERGLIDWMIFSGGIAVVRSWRIAIGRTTKTWNPIPQEPVTSWTPVLIRRWAATSTDPIWARIKFQVSRIDPDLRTDPDVTLILLLKYLFEFVWRIASSWITWRRDRLHRILFLLIPILILGQVHSDEDFQDLRTSLTVIKTWSWTQSCPKVDPYPFSVPTDPDPIKLDDDPCTNLKPSQNPLKPDLTLILIINTGSIDHRGSTLNPMKDRL